MAMIGLCTTCQLSTRCYECETRYQSNQQQPPKKEGKAKVIEYYDDQPTKPIEVEPDA